MLKLLFLRLLTLPLDSVTSISYYKEMYFSEWYMVTHVLAKFLVCMNRNCFYVASCQNSDIAIQFGNADFLKDSANLVTGRRIRALFKVQNQKSAIALFSQGP